VSQQYDQFRDAVSATHLPWDLPSNRRRPFAAEVRARELGAASLIACACDPCHGQRRAPEIARSERAMYGVLYVVSGRERLGHGRGELELGAGTFTVWDSSAPLRFDVPGPLRKLTLLVPEAVFAAALPRPQAMVGRVFDASTGAAVLLLSQLRALDTLHRRAGGLAPAEQEAALRSTLDLLGAATGGEPDDATSLVAEIVRHARAQLSDPLLDANRIADAIGISRRQLDRVFATTGSTITRWIWRERAERCRKAILLDPRTSLLTIAARWGFAEASHFTRVFRREYGLGPRAYRERALRVR